MYFALFPRMVKEFCARNFCRNAREHLTRLLNIVSRNNVQLHYASGFRAR